MLVTANNLVQMFFGWEGVGVASYLLIGFYYKKPSANAAAIKAPLREHGQILRYVRDRNPSGARDAMHFHVLSAATRANIAFLRP